MRGLVVLVQLFSLATLVHATEPSGRTHDVQDLIFFQPSRPLHLRMHLQDDGKPFQTTWNATLHELFQFLDYDGDGRLGAREVRQAPSVAQLRTMIQNTSEIEADAPPEMALLTDRPAEGVTEDQLRGYYHRVGLAPWQIDRVERAGLPSHLDDKLLEVFRATSMIPFAQASIRPFVAMMQRLDADGDETISALELSSSGYQGGFKGPGPVSPGAGEFFVLDSSDKGRSLLAMELIKRQDRNKDGRLTGGEIGFEPAVFQQLDRDGNKSLSLDELVTWPLLTPDLEIVVQRDGPLNQSVRVIGAEKGIGTQSRPATTQSRIGALIVPLREDLIELFRMDGTQQRQVQMRERAIASFEKLDQNKDKVLDSREVQQPPFTMVALSRLADRNSDDRISLAEYQGWVEVQQRFITRSVLITLVERGRCLFDFLDQDRDHRLSARELMTARKRLRPWMTRQGGAINREAIPRQFQVILSHGQLPRFDTDVGAPGAGRPEARLQGPLWFRKMDRNADGDVSLREFLGTTQQFQVLDIDRDGLIGLNEAQAAGSAINRDKQPRKP